MESGPGAQLLLITPGILIIIGITIWLVKSYAKSKGDNTVENRKAIISTILFVIGGVPLLIYPVVLIANLMSLAGEPDKSAPLILTVVCYAFLAVTSSYPLTYFGSLIIFKQRKKLLYAFAPLIHISVAVLLIFLWGAMEKPFPT